MLGGAAWQGEGLGGVGWGARTGAGGEVHELTAERRRVRKIGLLDY